jgi:hypothetical protein
VRDIPQELPAIRRPSKSQSPVQLLIEDPALGPIPSSRRSTCVIRTTKDNPLLARASLWSAAGWVVPLAAAIILAPFLAIVVAKLRRRMLVAPRPDGHPANQRWGGRSSRTPSSALHMDLSC